MTVKRFDMTKWATLLSETVRKDIKSCTVR